MPELTLFDLPSKDRNACWSLNPWKTRLALNYKGIDYETCWVEYPGIESKFSPHLPPNAPPATPYTIPTIRIKDSEYITDSRKIAARLEKDYPSPSLHLDSEVLPMVESIIPKILEPMRSIWLPLIPTNLLNAPSAEYFTRTRQEKFGKLMDGLKTEEAGEEAWMEAMPGYKALGELLGKEEGPFFLGTTPSYADFVVVGLLHMFGRIDTNILKKAVKIEPRLGELYEACKPWLKRDDH